LNLLLYTKYYLAAQSLSEVPQEELLDSKMIALQVSPMSRNTARYNPGV
jgi:hypothetical protein